MMELPVDQEKKTVASFRLKRARKYFDSAEYFLNGNVSSQRIFPPETPVVVQSAAGNSDEEMKKKYPNMKVRPQKSERKFFDSADYVLSGEQPLPHQHYRTPGTHTDECNEAKKLLAKKMMHKSKKYFDSADWASAGAGDYVPQLYPKLSLLKSG